ncbi:hypothetical protein HSB1_30810 [Halogranum salarium B-1]|uniref:Uncharacterized protein n=1 Tax=Halogranum salarium B-1 TaxID=1210908 RepID=J2ZZX7_9EURY|nr:hypothetical protein HSB1_30810 [Halogranum salarium B-1]
MGHDSFESVTIKMRFPNWDPNSSEVAARQSGNAEFVQIAVGRCLWSDGAGGGVRTVSRGGRI